MTPAAAVANREVKYRGFLIRVGASERFGGVLLVATLTGGPDRVARSFGLPSPERDVDCACAIAIHELRKVVDDLLERKTVVRGSVRLRGALTSSEPSPESPSEG
jgi:hypothetical protein